ncbi:LysR family transcriptional regulator [Photobacterium rosenbergii]|uniref:LysR family transcriptional regulator n=1 Tax=Photobacterium rosenbergii TaxID=294936 RepID=A0A2T3N845_9GAMM|nr:LysR family transcriptional regulator [Photobacterium rosenbergii]PSW09367.1 LysR family transcriptional regulator [Photobacterium rosenbergii]
MLPSQLPLFICAAQEGSFSAAGRKIGISAAAVSKGVAALEKQTGVRLFHRNTRQFSLTEDGASLYQRVAPLLSELEESIDGLAEQNRSPAGKLRVNLPDSFGRKFIMPHISEFLTLYPDIELDVVLSDRVLDIIDEGFDVSIGNQINEDSRLVARTIYQMQSGIFASKAYIEQFGLPESIEDLQHHNAIIYRPLTSGRTFTWPLRDSNGEHIQFIPKGNLTLSSISPAKNLMLQNLGIAYMGKWHVEDELASGDVVPILESAWTSAKPVWIYYSSRENLPKRTRLFIDFIVSKLSI